MGELDLRNSPWNDGLAVDQKTALREVYYLLCIFLASQKIDRLDVFTREILRPEFQESEINHKLISLAIIIRNSWDQNPNSFEYHLKDYSQQVGKLWKNIKRPTKAVPLDFREACHKILHCTSINYHYQHNKPKLGYALANQVHLYGWKKDENWKATLNIIEFCKLAVQVL